MERFLSTAKTEVQYIRDEKTLVSHTPIKLKREAGDIRSQKSGVLVTVHDMTILFANLHHQWISSAINMGLSFFILILLFGGVITHYIRKNIAYFIDATEKINLDEGGVYCQFKGQGELAQLGTALNKMADKLYGYYQKQRSDEAIIKKQARFDSLTELPNRHMAISELNQNIADTREQGKTAVFFIDLDDFKKINDSLGHNVGDELLVQVARRLGRLYVKDRLVARLGGDEFILLVWDFKDKTLIEEIADEIIQLFDEPFLVFQHTFSISSSIGIALYPDDGRSTTDLLQRADAAMYNAKAMGRNKVSFFTPEMHRQTLRRLRVEQALSKAVQKGEMVVHFQPKFNVSDLRVVGAEALIRWTSRELGSVSPKEFIPIAEQSGAIHEISEFVLTQSLAFCSQWQARYQDPFRVAMNVSPVSMGVGGFADSLSQRVEASQIRPGSFEVELTEGMLLKRDDRILRMLNQLNRSQIYVSIDDFGTGYSSLS